MIKEFPSEEAFSVEKFQTDIMQYVAAESGEDFIITAKDSGEYAYESNGIEDIVLFFQKGKVTIMDIVARNPGSGAGSHVVGALTELAEEMDFDVFAKDVLPDAEEWWQRMNFVPTHEGSADYMYGGES